MNLQDHRNLSTDMQGEDVALIQSTLRKLGYDIPADEFDKQFFGPATRAQVMALQERNGLEATGVVNQRTIGEISRQVNALHPQPKCFIVKGLVRQQEGNPLVSAIVQAFDKDLRRQEQLGKTITNADGYYEISYTSDQIRRAEKGSADLSFQVSISDGTQYAITDIIVNKASISEPKIIFNASTEVWADLIVVPQPKPQLSEYEQLLATLNPVLEDVQLAGLTDEDITFLVGETGIERQRLDWLRQSAILAQETNLATEVFYGFARRKLPLKLEELLVFPTKDLRRALERAVKQNIVPASLRDSLDEIVERLEQLKIKRGFLVRHRVVGQLLNQETGAPLVNFTVYAFDLEADPEPKDLGSDITNGNGLFAVVYITPRQTPLGEPAADEAGRRLRLQIRDTQAQEIYQTEVLAVADQQQPLEIRVHIPAVPEPPTHVLTELATTLQLDLPPELLSFLSDQGIHTLGDVRKAGGIGQLPGLPVAADSPAVRTLEVNADLVRLSPDVQFNASLIERGYDSVFAIANASRTDFVSAVHDRVGDFKAAQIQVMARAQTHFLNNVLTGMAVEQANNYQYHLISSESALESEPNKLFPESCSCRDCEAAVSPLVYLVDLLNYTTKRLKNNNIQLVVSDLVTLFHQPFDTLTASCESADTQIRQVRLCVEVLRSYLKSHPPTARQQTALRQAEKDYRLAAYTALLTKIGTSYAEIRLARTADPTTRQALAERLAIKLNHLNALFLDPDANPAVLTEQRLEQLFGLIDTTRPDLLLPVATPDLQTWRLQYLRTLWKQQALRTRNQPPIIDPDLISRGDLKNPVQGDPAFDLWEQRDRDVNGQLDKLRAANASKDLAGLNTILERTLSVTMAQFLAIAEARDKGNAISERLDQLTLQVGEFNYLLRIRKLAEQNQPILDSEWENVYAILIQVWKRRNSAQWREEEKTRNILLGPDFFQIPQPDPTQFPPREVSPPKEPTAIEIWRAPREARQEWQDQLQSRLDQEQIVIQSLKEAVSAAEEASLPMLRDALVLAINVPETDLDIKAKWVTKNLLIEARGSGCMMTTRVAQAIETLQGLFLALRLGQLEDNFRTFELNADHFDKEWKWMGSYATWRAAMFVFLYPENILLPSLRDGRQTPGFETLVKNLSTKQQLRLDRVCEETKRYSAYFREVSSLHLEASCQTQTRLLSQSCLEKEERGYRCLLYLFARAEYPSKAVYWSTYDPLNRWSSYAQTFWEVVPGLENAIKVIGAVPQEISPEKRFIFLFVKTLEGDSQKLAFVKYDLENQGWVDGVTSLALLNNPKEFIAVTKQTEIERDPPHLTIQIGGILYEQKLNLNRSDWAESDWEKQKIYLDPWSDPRRSGRDYERDSAEKQGFRGLNRLCGMVSSGAEADAFFLLLYDNYSQLWCFYHASGFSPEELLHGETPTEFAWWNFGNVQYRGAFFWPNTSQIYLVTAGLGSALSTLWLISVPYIGPTVGNMQVTSVGAGTQGLEIIVPMAGFVREDIQFNKRRFAFQRTDGPYCCLFVRSDNTLTEFERVRVAPFLPAGPFEIPGRLSSTSLKLRRAPIEKAFIENSSATHTNLTYLEEAYYFIPVHIALQLQRQGEYTAALDWFRTVYDYTTSKNERKIYYGLVKEESLSETYKRDLNWLLDPLNPHAIAATRKNTYTRFTLLSIIRCLLDYADAEFTQDTPESNPRARRLYMTALELWNTAELKQRLNGCENIIGTLDEIEVTDAQWEMSVKEIKRELRGIPNASELREVVAQLREVLTQDETWEHRFVEAREIVTGALAKSPQRPTLAAVLQEEERLKFSLQKSVLANSNLSEALQTVGSVAASDFLQTVSMVTGISPLRLEGQRVELPWLRQPLTLAPTSTTTTSSSSASVAIARRDVARPDILEPTYMANLAQVAAVEPTAAMNSTTQMDIDYTPSLAFSLGCIPPNPILSALRLHAELNLYKLRTCRNIAGMKQQLEPYAAPTDTTTGLPTIGAGGQLLLPGTTTLRPTLYRYAVLVERAKQLVQLAAQIESAMLSTLEKRDVEAYNLLKARQELKLAQAGVQLQSLRLTEANDGVTLATLQQKRAEIQVKTYQDWIQAGFNEYEKAMINHYQNAAKARIVAALADTDVQVAQAFTTAATAGPTSVAAAAAGAFLVSLAAQGRGLSTSRAIAEESGAQVASVYANYERRKQEWELQEALAQQDVAIGAQQITLANDRVEVVKQEKVIADIQSSNAKDTIEFLTTKFTNIDLYDWMSDILERVYSFFLQQATAMAKLAENQLAFERQEVPPAYIQADYWEAPTDGATLGNTNGKAPDRRGLTGSARLLQDIYQLDQYAFDTKKRKLQLTKTLSLAQLAPAEFQRFRETGVMLFATPMELFDRGFPGHYLRLIERVRTSVIALIPPTQGIYATLSTTAISRVVIGGDLFQRVPIRRDPESVALSSPSNATGLFELEPQSDMLLPFQGSGVDTTWEFRMPKAANLFDYRTVADVLVTIDYTALYKFDYYQQVIQSSALTRPYSADMAFSFRNQFADQWYDLHNPEQTSPPMTVRFQTIREDFPPNIENLKIQQVVLYFARSTGKSFEIPVTQMRFTGQGNQGAVGGGAASIDGVISTRRGNAGSWTAMIGKSPDGEWELALPNTEEMRNRFKDEEIEDILFVITYSGRTPEWPV